MKIILVPLISLFVCLFVCYSAGRMLVISPAHIIYSSAIHILLPV